MLPSPRVEYHDDLQPPPLVRPIAEQGIEEVTGVTTTSGAAGDAVSSIASRNTDGEEYFEDYVTGVVTSRAAYADNDARLRGAASADSVAAADANGGDEEGPAWSKWRSLGSSSSGYDSYAEDLESTDVDAEYELDEEEQYNDEYSYNEYDIDGYVEYDDNDEDNDEDGFEDDRAAAADSDADDTSGAWALNQRNGQTMTFSDRHNGLESRVLELLEGAYATMFGDQQGASRLTGKARVGSQSAGAAASSSLTASSASSNIHTVASSATSAATDIASSGSSAADFGYDSYEDRADTRTGVDTADGGSLYIGYEYEVYDDYYEVRTSGVVIGFGHLSLTHQVGYGLLGFRKRVV
jgi:hypothetical protein